MSGYRVIIFSEYSIVICQDIVLVVICQVTGVLSVRLKIVICQGIGFVVISQGIVCSSVSLYGCHLSAYRVHVICKHIDGLVSVRL